MTYKKWFVYIIQTESGKLYTGITNDINKRFNNHLTGKSGARFFRFSQPTKIVFLELVENRSEASKRESFIKKLSKLEKIELINQQTSLEISITSDM